VPRLRGQGGVEIGDAERNVEVEGDLSVQLREDETPELY